MNIKIISGTVFLDDEPTTDPELIGYALLDFAETVENDGMTIELRDSDVFVT
ncbi:hypothetical protein [Flavobacterium sp. 25HG05S-40]|uniref:hypothetical protein n=1 Tax=Flavobacterium sp. 25HG05S-40 TaxID=3458682 RepID=UPI004043D447